MQIDNKIYDNIDVMILILTKIKIGENYICFVKQHLFSWEKM